MAEPSDQSGLLRITLAGVALFGAGTILMRWYGEVEAVAMAVLRRL